MRARQRQDAHAAPRTQRHEQLLPGAHSVHAQSCCCSAVPLCLLSISKPAAGCIMQWHPFKQTAEPRPVLQVPSFACSPTGNWMAVCGPHNERSVAIHVMATLCEVQSLPLAAPQYVDRLVWGLHGAPCLRESLLCWAKPGAIRPCPECTSA